MTPLVERIARLLADKGQLSTKEIAALLDESTDRVSDATRQPRTMGRYGLSVVGRCKGDGRGHPPKILSVDVRTMERYLALRGPFTQQVKLTRKKVHETPLAAKKPKPPTPKEPKVVYGRAFPVYNGPHRTVWQPSSPYRKELDGQSED